MRSLRTFFVGGAEEETFFSSIMPICYYRFRNFAESRRSRSWIFLWFTEEKRTRSKTLRSRSGHGVTKMRLRPSLVARCWFKKTPNVLKKTSPKPAQITQTSPNYSQKFAIKPAVCSESNHHYLIAVAVFVQHTIDLSYSFLQSNLNHYFLYFRLLSYKATWNIKNNNI